METKLSRRKPNRLKFYDYAQNGAYFITICTKNRCKIFWQTPTEWETHVGASIARPQRSPRLTPWGKIAEQAILQIPRIYPTVTLEKYAVMPNHIHMLLLLESEQGGRAMLAPTIPRVIQQYKGAVAKQIGQSVWQKSFHDHVVRTAHGHEKIWQYIDTNPQTWQNDCFYEELL